MKNQQVSRRRFVLSGGIAATAAAMIPGQVQAVHGYNDLSNETNLSTGQEKPSDGIYNVKDFGAKGDGVSLDTAAINQTIEYCSQNGGGKVLIPPGVYLSGTIHLRSNIVFHIESGATISGSNNLEDYHSVQDEKRRSQWFSSLILGENISNVEISGQGVVNGNNVFNPEGEEEMRGPHAILFHKSEDITIRDIFVKDAGNYAHIMQDCTNGSLRGVRVSGGWDGANLQDCKNFLITDCQFTTGDDCVAGGGWENFVVSNCTWNSSCDGTKIYRPGLKDVVFSNIVITGPGLFPHRTHFTPSKIERFIAHKLSHGPYDSGSGFNLYGGGLIENLLITNVVITGVRRIMTLSSRVRSDGSPPIIRNVQLNNLSVTGIGKPGLASLIQGIEERPIENILFSDITIRSVSEGPKVVVHKPFPGQPDDPNCSGLYCRYIKDMEMHNVRFEKLENDERPVIICEKIDYLQMDNVRCLNDTDPQAFLLRDIKTLKKNNTETVD